MLIAHIDEMRGKLHIKWDLPAESGENALPYSHFRRLAEHFAAFCGNTENTGEGLCEIKTRVTVGEKEDTSYRIDFYYYENAKIVLYHRIGEIWNGQFIRLPARLPRHFEGWYDEDGKRVYYRNTFVQNHPRFSRYPEESAVTTAASRTPGGDKTNKEPLSQQNRLRKDAEYANRNRR